MAEPFATFDSFMRELSGSEPISGPSYATAGTGAPVAGGAPAAQPTQGATAQGQAGAPATPAPGQTLSGFTSDVERQRSALSGAESQFQQQAGPSRSADSVDISGAVSSALGGGPSEPVRSLATAQYSGPTGLDRGTLDSITQAFQRLTPQAGALLTRPGVDDALRQETAGLTSGQRRMEATARLADPNYRSAATDAQTALKNLTSEFFSKQDTARQFAGQRAAEESAIRERTLGALGSERDTLNTSLAARVAPEQAKNAALQAAYDKYTASGSAEDLAALDALTPEDLSAGYNTETQARVQEAARLRQAIMSDPRFAAIADIPELGLGVTRKGREALFLTPADAQKLKASGKSKKQIKEIQTLARQRQHELEAQFSPGTAQRAAGQQDTSRDFKANQAAGAFADVAPIYFTEGIDQLNPEDPRSFINFNPSAGLTPQGLSTPEEQQRYNLIADLMGSPERMDPTLGYTPAGLASNAEGYQAAEQGRLSRNQKTIAANKAHWQKVIKKSRKQYSTNLGVGAVTRGGIGGFGRGLGGLMGPFGEVMGGTRQHSVGRSAVNKETE